MSDTNGYPYASLRQFRQALSQARAARALLTRRKRRHANALAVAAGVGLLLAGALFVAGYVPAGCGVLAALLIGGALWQVRERLTPRESIEP